MKLRSKLTLIRIILVLAFFIFIMVRKIPFGQSIAIFIFVLSVLLGIISKNMDQNKGQNTKFNRIMEPLSETLLIATALIALVELHIIPAWTAAIIIGAEFAISGLIGIAVSEKITIKESRWDTSKTVLQTISVIFALLCMNFRKLIKQGNFIYIHINTVERFLKCGTYIIFSAALIVTIISCADYFSSNRSLFMNDK
ncbi:MULTISPECIES: CDP-alcohol phosphatidyltransferase family protein [Clostridium]|uniref:CDP-alcohol phosphatidyltransferase family protein n=1 Tax=Clostridium TaxID=1485 RepID=UPI000826F412|nr:MULTISPECIES: CDP-alcohol phosphatidyltransferase family protein [Clostridium]PJI08223.1 CDP-diacylglycerol--glycerol-3-phosphate 3-phosphatidyltransferase [Clostridium sp. CT7]